MKKIMNIYETLDNLEISYLQYKHQAVYTCEQAALLKDIPGFRIKNLFLRDDKGKQHFIVVAPENKKIDIKLLASKLNVKKLSFASSKRLKLFLGIETGAVSPLALINDKKNVVKLYFDNELKDKNEIPFHPLINTETLVLSISSLEKFLNAMEHQINFIEI